jgi:adhesin transport system outer membrane protein
MLLLCSSGASAETLEQAIARAVLHFPEIHAAQARREAASAQTGQARAELFPSVNIAAGEGRERSRNVSTRAVGVDPTLTRQEADVSISQLLFDGGAATGQLRRFGARTEGAAFTVNDTAETVGSRAGQAFTEVRRLREQLGIARENVAIHEKTLSDVNELANAGRGRRADVTQADARRALALSSLAQLTGQLGQAEAAYKNLTGVSPPNLDTPQDLSSKLPTRAEEAVSGALAAHPAVRAAEKELEAAQYDRESAQARLTIPRVTVEAGASRNRDVDGIVGPNQDRYAMLRLRYNLFRGLGDSERVRETEARITEALAGLSRVRNDLERDVRQAWEALAADRARLPVLASYARSSADVAEAYRLQFQIGQRSLLDVLNAENESFNARAGYVAGRETVTAGEVRLLASMGRLLDTLGIARPAPTPAEPSGMMDSSARRTDAPPARESVAAAPRADLQPAAAPGWRGLRMTLDLPHVVEAK